MGFHRCEYCKNDTSSGDVQMKFVGGRTWVMPDMILHYVGDHDFKPSITFVNDVLTGRLDSNLTDEQPQKVGYLSGPFFTWGTEHSNEKAVFFLALWKMLKASKLAGNRSQTRGMTRS